MSEPRDPLRDAYDDDDGFAEAANPPEEPSSSGAPIEEVVDDTTDKKEGGGGGYPCNAEAYTLLAEIGVGAFATVYRATVAGFDEEVAIKVLDLEELNTNWEEIRKEILTMRQLRHPNVVPIHCAFVQDEELWIVMPLMIGGSCANILKSQFPRGIKDESVIATIILDVLKGLQYFHKDAKIHRDIKAGNILISAKGEVQLADFGVAASLLEHGDRKKHGQTFVGTPCWMAPEVMEQTNGYDYKADIWSVGITCMELGFGMAPYAQYQPMKVLLMTLQEEPPTPDFYNDNSYKFHKLYAKFIGHCLQKDPKKRPTAAKLMGHPFIVKFAKNNNYLVDKLLKNLPPLGKQTQTIPRAKTERKKQQTRKPISVGSWKWPTLADVKKHMSEHKSGHGIPEDRAVGQPAPDAHAGAPVHTPAPAPAPVPQQQQPPSQSHPDPAHTAPVGSPDERVMSPIHANEAPGGPRTRGRFQLVDGDDRPTSPPNQSKSPTLVTDRHVRHSSVVEQGGEQQQGGGGSDARGFVPVQPAVPSSSANGPVIQQPAPTTAPADPEKKSRFVITSQSS